MISEKLEKIGVEYLHQILFTKPKSIKDFSVAKSVNQCRKDDMVLLECFPNTQHPIRDTYPSRENKLKIASVNWSFLSRDNYKIFTTVFSGRDHVSSIKEAITSIHARSYRYYMYGKITLTDKGFLVLSNPEYVPARLVGKFIPEYSTIKKVTGDEFEGAIAQILDNPDAFASALNEAQSLFSSYKQQEITTALKLASQNSLASIKDVIMGLHRPTSMEQYEHAITCLNTLAGMKAINDGLSHKRIESPGNQLNVLKDDLNKLISRMPFTMTSEQTSIAHSMLDSICSPFIAKEILSADVGYGKTCVFGNVAAAVAMSGHPVVIYEPTSILATQVATNLLRWWPELKVSVVTGKIKPKDIRPAEGQIIIGTTAVNKFCEIWGIRPALVICDEEHKFGTKQRNQIIDSVNYISSTATCIPRTMQLGMLGAFNVHRITKCHITKNIQTTIRSAKDIHSIFNTIQQVLQKKEKVLIVYPLAENDESKEKSTNKNSLDAEKFSAEAAFDEWNKTFPGRVALVYGGMDPVIKQKNIDLFKSGAIELLVSTTAVEVGLDIPRLTYGLVVGADRHGLAGLHQLRGRVARDGGEGIFDLLIPVNDIPEPVRNRLSILEKTLDGYLIAEHDLMIRGFGDLTVGGVEQSGAIKAFSLNMLITPQQVKDAQSVLDLVRGEGGALKNPDNTIITNSDLVSPKTEVTTAPVHQNKQESKPISCITTSTTKQDNASNVPEQDKSSMLYKMRQAF